jgi:hypothetical protein
VLQGLVILSHVQTNPDALRSALPAPEFQRHVRNREGGREARHNHKSTFSLTGAWTVLYRGFGSGLVRGAAKFQGVLRERSPDRLAIGTIEEHCVSANDDNRNEEKEDDCSHLENLIIRMLYDSTAQRDARRSPASSPTSSSCSPTGQTTRGAASIVRYFMSPLTYADTLDT